MKSITHSLNYADMPLSDSTDLHKRVAVVQHGHTPQVERGSPPVSVLEVFLPDAQSQIIRADSKHVLVCLS